MRLFKNKTPTRPEMSREEALAYKPVVSREVRAERTEAGLVRIRYPVAFKPWFAGLARRLGRKGQGGQEAMLRTLELDAMGSTVWDWLDGQNTVHELAARLADHYGLHEREAEVSMSAFLRELGRRGIIGLAR